MSNLLTKLKKQIAELERQIQQSALLEHQEYYFDEHLFYTSIITTNSAFYLERIQQTYQALEDSVTAQKIEQITFLSETLINQMTALTRELATHQLRKKEPDIIEESLAEKHSRHLDYLRRLQEMKYEQELNPKLIDQTKIAALDNRIDRCERAIKKIEIEMENDANSPSALYTETPIFP